MLKSLGGWPVLEGDKWNDADFTWKDSVYKFRTAGYSVDYFIDFSISTDLKNTTMRAIDVSIWENGTQRWTGGFKEKNRLELDARVV